VNGDAGGLGRAITELLADTGARVAVCDIDQDALTDLRRALDELRSPSVLVHRDVRKPEDVRLFFGAVTGRFERLDILVTVPGGTFTAAFTDTTRRGWDTLIALNFTQILDSIHVPIPLLRAGGGGSIVNVTSSEAHRAAPGVAVYAAMKAAIENLSRTLALELARDGIRVNCVAPDPFPTPNGIRVGAFPQDLESEDVQTSNEVTIPLGRMGRATEVAGAVLFLASTLATYVTGTTLIVDGGVLAAGGWYRRLDGYSTRLPSDVATALALTAKSRE